MRTRILLTLPLVLVLTGCFGVDKQAIHTYNEYLVARYKVEDQTLDVLRRYTFGEALTGEDLAKLENAMPLVDAMIQYDPTSLERYSLKGKALRALGRTDEALEAMRTGINLCTIKQDDLAKLVKADVYSEIASIHFQRKEYEEADRVMGFALATSQADPRFLTEAARVKVQLGDMVTAKQYCEQALLLDSEYPTARALWQLVKNAPGAAPSSAPKSEGKR